mgnify:CR=1 FL=1
MPDLREVKESPIFQGEDESIAYTLTTTPWGSSPSSPVLTVKTVSGVNITSTVAPGSASAAGDIITCPAISGLQKDNRYRLEIKFTISGNVLEAWADLLCRQ